MSLSTAISVVLVIAVLSVEAQLPNAGISPPSPPVLPPSPYNFGYEFGDGFGMKQHRHESADGNGNVRGSYGYTDPFDVSRIVEYTAGIDGFKAVVKSNEPGLSNHVVADGLYVVQPPPPGAVAQGLTRANAVVGGFPPLK